MEIWIFGINEQFGRNTEFSKAETLNSVWIGRSDIMRNI